MYKIIDLFAGPGGLAEGFSSVTTEKGKRIFNIALSIECNPAACETLLLRNFFRQFPIGKVPPEYYEYLRGDITKESLYKAYENQYLKARDETWEITLGATDNSVLDSKITKCLDGNKNWVLIGGPPCQAYSLIGRAKMKNMKGKDFDSDPRHTLYKEYLRIISKHHPAIFVMENVKGILSSKLDGNNIFVKIKEDLQNPSNIFKTEKEIKYKIYSLSKKIVKKDSDFVVKSDDFGIPQRRHRVIIIGVRQDISAMPEVISPKKSISVGEVLQDLPQLRAGLSKEEDSLIAWKNIFETMKETKICDNDMGLLIKSMLNLPLSRGTLFQKRSGVDMKGELNKWFYDNKLEGVTDHVTRSHMGEDIKRYFYISYKGKISGVSPTLSELPKQLLPKHANVPEARKTRALFNDRFRVQIKDLPSSTITSHISKDGHYFIHYDPVQARSLTPREAARIQTFPDNYKFEGNRTEQYHQIGNAVPPLLAKQIAEIVRDMLKKR